MFRSFQPLLLCAFLLGGLGLIHLPAHAQPTRLTIALGTAPQTLDPRFAVSPGERHLTELIYESLVTQNEALQWVPQLAERWELVRDTEYLVTLKPGVWFHDGTAFTAERVKAVFDVLLEPSAPARFQRLADLLASCEVEDERTVRFFLHEPLPESLFLSTLQVPIFKFRGTPNSKSGVLVGSGPFRQVSHNSAELVFRRHWYYRDGSPDVKELHFQIVPEAETRIRRLLNGSIDIVNNAFPIKELAKFRTPTAQSKFTLLEEIAATYRYLVFNTEHPILQEVQVRQAIGRALHREELVAFLTKNHARLASGVFPPEHAFHVTTQNLVYAPESAVALLEDAGFRLTEEQRFQLRLTTSNDKEQIRLARLIADQLARVGIEVNVTPQSSGKFRNALAGGDYDLAVLQDRVQGDPDVLRAFFHSSQTPEKGGRNFARYRNLELDALLESGRYEQNRAQRREIYQQVQRMLAEALPHLPLWYGNNLALVSRRVSGYRFHPAGDFHAFRTLRVN